MFYRVQSYELWKNRKYKIIANQEFTGIYKGTAILENNLYLTFDKVYNTTEKEYVGVAYFLTPDLYRFFSKKARIQSDMERRAVNQIVRRIIGDDCFVW